MSRLCELAGVPYSSRRGGLLRENKKEKEKEEGSYHEGDMHDEGMYEEDEEKDEMMSYEGEDHDEGYHMHEDPDVDYDNEGSYHEGKDEEVDEDDDEMVEIDEKELVQELRRARRIMQEGKRKAAFRKHRRRQALQESQLKAVIDQEVKNVLKEMDLNLNSSWVYGKRKPRKSRHGYTHQGSYLKGIGFK